MRSKFPRITGGRLLLSVLGALCVTVLILFLVRGAIERRLLERYVAQKTGVAVSIGDVQDALASLSLDTFALENVRLEAGGTVLDVPRLDVRTRGTLGVVLQSPHAAVALAAATTATDQLGSIIAWLRASRAQLRIVNGGLDILPAAGEALHVDVLGGTFAFAAATETYAVQAALQDGGRTYPFAAQAEPHGEKLHHVWTAAVLPAGALTALGLGAGLALDGGELHDVSIVNEGVFTADATLVDVEAAVGGHRLRGLRGPLALRGDRLGSTGIQGTLNNAPFSFVGEVHDFSDPALDIHTGTPGLQALGRLLTMVAAQHALQFTNLETTAPGIAFAQYGARSAVGPRVISLIVVDPKEPSIKLGTAISADHVISKGERTSQLAQRTGAVAGVNGDYFDIGRSYEPQGLFVRDGAIVRGPTDRAALVIDRSNKVTFSEFRLSGTVETRGRSYPITQVNSWPPGEATVITPDYGISLPPAAAKFVRLAPVDPGKHLFRATSVEAADAGLDVSYGIGFGPLAAGADPRVGDRFRVEYRLVPSVDGIVAGIGGGPILLRDGAWYEDRHAPAPAERDVRWPVVALGSTADGLLVFAAVDGRHPERAVGMTRPEFAELLRSYGVRDAMALDSGGSVTLVSRAPGARVASVRNTPSDDSAERYISDALLVFSSAPPDDLFPVLAPAPATR